MKQSFQDGVDTLYNKCVSCGQTPTDKSPTSISNAIQDIYNNRYNEGYEEGQSSGKNYYRLRFRNTDVNTDRSTAEGWIYNAVRVVFNFSSSNTGHYNNGIIGIYDESNSNSRIYYKEDAGALSGVSLNLNSSHTYRVYIRTGGGTGHNCTFDGTCYYS